MYKHWLSRLLDDSAFPLIVLAVATSQIHIGHHRKDAVPDQGRPAIGLQLDNRFQPDAGKYDLHAAEGAASEPAHNK
jgi:hypothetical protein